MQKLEILSGNRILVSSSQGAIVVGVFQFFHPRRVSSKLFVKLSNRPRVLHATMNQLFFVVALDLLNRVLEVVLRRLEKSDGENGNEQHQEQKDVTLLVAAMLTTKAHGKSTAYPCAHPCVSGMLWRLLLSTSRISTALGEMRTTL